MIDVFEGINWAHPLTKYYFSAALIVWPAALICARFQVTRGAVVCLALPYIGFAALCVFLAVAGRDKKRGVAV